MEWMHRLDAEMRKIRKQQMKQLGQRGRSAEESQKGDLCINELSYLSFKHIFCFKLCNFILVCLHLWFLLWESKLYLEGKKDESDDFMTSSDEDSECEDDDGLCNTILLTGPHGSGKSAVVYALAKELGYKVSYVDN